MALKPLQYGMQPLGQFDGLDATLTWITGGEVVGFTYVNLPSAGGTDEASADVINDGYVGFTTPTRPAATPLLVSGMRPLFLADDGILYYGTLFGRICGSNCGQDALGAQLGPHTALGSGKITLWSQPGLYTVSLDNVDTNNVTGLNPNNPTLAGGAPLYAMPISGHLTPNVGAAFEAVIVGRFIEFSTNLDTLVNTPKYLIEAVNSPTGNPTTSPREFNWAVIYFHLED